MIRATLIAVALVVLAGCQSFRTVINEEGPALTRTATAVSMRLWLQKTEADHADVVKYRTVILEARGLINNGDVPASTLDIVADLLNEQIDNDIVRSVIQQGIDIIKRRIEIPTDGLLSTEVKIWVNAVLDGAVDGINDYLALPPDMPAAHGAPVLTAGTNISFR